MQSIREEIARIDLEVLPEEVRKELKESEVEEKKLRNFFRAIAKGINQSADGINPNRYYGWTMKERPFIGLKMNLIREIGAKVLEVSPDSLEELLTQFGPEDGKVLRPCLIKLYSNDSGKREMLFVLNWDKVRQFDESLPVFSQLERRRKRPVDVIMLMD
jgi:hypothetical protein